MHMRRNTSPPLDGRASPLWAAPSPSLRRLASFRALSLWAQVGGPPVQKVICVSALSWSWTWSWCVVGFLVHPPYRSSIVSPSCRASDRGANVPVCALIGSSYITNSKCLGIRLLYGHLLLILQPHCTYLSDSVSQSHTQRRKCVAESLSTKVGSRVSARLPCFCLRRPSRPANPQRRN